MNVMDEHVLRGNTAILKCHIPSFVADYVSVASWLQEGQGREQEIREGHDYGSYICRFR